MYGLFLVLRFNYNYCFELLIDLQSDIERLADELSINDAFRCMREGGWVGGVDVVLRRYIKGRMYHFGPRLQ